MIEPKVSRADLRYTPNCKELKDVVCFPMDDKETLIKILDHYIDTNQITNTGGGQSNSDGGDF